MSDAPKHYRLRLATALPARFHQWFPQLSTARIDEDATTVIEGPVADSCQLAGIVSAICHRDGEILSLRQLDAPADTRD